MSKKQKVAVYPGSFNPVHPGHLHVIRQAAELFDKVYVLVAENPEKLYKVPADVRASWLDKMTTGFYWKKNVIIDISSKSLVDYCKDHNIEFVVRGLRDGKDLDYEKVQAEYNRVLSDEPAKLKYVYFTTPAHAAHLSSSSIRQFIKYATFEKMVNLYFLGGWGSFTDAEKEIFDSYKE